MLRVGPTNILSALLRSHAGLPGQGADLSVETTQILAALSKAQTVQEKNAILEAFLLRRGAFAEQTGPAQPADEFSADEKSDAVWRISYKSAEAISGLRPEQSSRQWEIDAIIRSIIEQVHSGQRGEHVAGVALPFKPTSQDMSKAIEALGYSSRALYSEPMRENTHDETLFGSSFPAMRLCLTVLGLLFLAVFFLRG